MAHEYNAHRADKVQKARVGKISKGYATGGGIRDDGMPNPPRAKGGSVKKPPGRMDGGAVKQRADKVARAKGGRVKSKGSTNVNVIIAPAGGEKPPMAGLSPGMPPMPPMPPKPPMPAPAPAGLGPNPGLGGMPPLPPGMPPRADGGRAFKKGGAVKMSGEKKLFGKKRADGGLVDRKGKSLAEGDPASEPVEARRRGDNWPPAKTSDRAKREPQPTDLYEPDQVKRLETQRARGGKVGGIAQGYTQVQHSGNKSDTQNIGRKAPITKAAGGAIYADGRKGKQMAWLSGVGAGGGKGRLKKAHHA